MGIYQPSRSGSISQSCWYLVIASIQRVPNDDCLTMAGKVPANHTQAHYEAYVRVVGSARFIVSSILAPSFNQ